jgi:hypothetical protein
MPVHDLLAADIPPTVGVLDLTCGVGVVDGLADGASGSFAGDESGGAGMAGASLGAVSSVPAM